MTYMRDGSGRRIDDRLLAEAPSVTPPANPVPNQVWLSSALRDVSVPTDPRARQAVLTHTLAWEANALQEPSAWIANGKIYVLYTAGVGGPGLAWCDLTDDPTNPASWTKHTAGPVIAAFLNHGSVYREGDTLYYFANDGTTNASIKCYTADVADPTTWTAAGTAMTLPATGNAFGNTFVVKDAGVYKMLIEYKIAATGKWQMGMASSATLTGPYELVPGAEILDILFPDPYHQGASGATGLVQENGEWVLYYHCTLNYNSLLPSDAYRAVAPSLTGNNWTVLDGGRPLVSRVTALEVDQIADLELLRTDSGVNYLFWVGMHNRDLGGGFVGGIHCAALIPKLKRWNGSQWTVADETASTVRPITEMGKPRSVYRETDLTLSPVLDGGGVAQWQDVPGMSMTFTPTGTDFEVEINGVVAPTGSTGYKYLWRAVRVDTGGTYMLGALTGTGGAAAQVSMAAKITKVTPAKPIGVKLQVLLAAGSGNVYVRPVGQSGNESLRFRCVDSAYP